MYSVVVDDRVSKDMKHFPSDAKQIILRKIDLLGSDPWPTQSKKLKNRPGFRLRVGNYRVIYDVLTEDKQIVVYEVGHRKDIYR